MEQFKQQLKAFVQNEISLDELESDLQRCLGEQLANANAIQQVLATLGSQGILEKENVEHLSQIVLDAQAPSAELDSNVDLTVGFQELLKQYLNRSISLATVKAGLRLDLENDTNNIVRYDKVLSALAKRGSTLPIEEINELLEVIDSVNEASSGAPSGDDEEADAEKTVFMKRKAPSQTEAEDENDEKTVFKKRKVDSSRRRDRTSRTHTSRTGTSRTKTSTGTDTKWAKPFEQDEVQLGVGSLLRNGRYRLTEFIGYGGMGDVYKAEDTLSVEAGDLDHKDYAVKVLNKEFRDHPESLKTLQRETRKTANLSHEHIVNVFSIDRDEQSIFMVMEFMRGEDLRDILKKNPSGLSREKAIRYILEMSDALRYAHTQDIIHSDFKPGNVFIDNDSVKVIDFGIARAADDGKADSFDAGDLGALTPSYASLEMLVDGDNPDPKDDIYALGCLSYELLTGQHPFMEDKKKIPADKAQEKGMKPAPIPGLKSWQWNAIRGCLEFEREDRLGDLVQFINDMKMEKRPLSLKLVGGSAAAVIGVIAGSFALVELRDSYELSEFADLLKERKHEEILVKMAELQESYKDDSDRLDEFFSDNEATLVYFLARIQQSVENDDFELVLPLLEVFKKQYPDGARVIDAAKAFDAARNKRVLELDTEIKDFLKAPNFKENYRELEGLWEVSKRVKKDTPQESAAKLVILELQDTAIQLEKAQAIAEASELVDFSIDLFKSDERVSETYQALVVLQEPLKRALGEVETAQQIAQIEARLGTFNASSTLEELKASADDVLELSKLVSDNNTYLDAYRLRLDQLLSQDVTDLIAARDWSKAIESVERFGAVLGAAPIAALKNQVNQARTDYDERSTDLMVEIGQTARSSKPGNAMPLLNELKLLGVPEATIQLAQNQVAQGWLQQAKIQTTQNNFTEAESFIDQALAIAKEPAISAQLSEQLEVIKGLKVDSESQVASEKAEQRQLEQAKQIASLEMQISSEIETVELNSEAVAKTIRLLDELEVLAVNNPLLGSARERLSERYLSRSQELVDSGDLDNAISLIQSSLAVLPSIGALSERRSELQQLVSQQLAQQAADKSSEMESDIRTLVSSFVANRDSNQLVRMLEEYETAVSGQNVFSKDIRFQAADAWVQEAQDLVENNRFDEAERAITSARRFDSGHGRIDGLVNLVADSRVAYQEDQLEIRRDAEIAGLKQSFVNQLRAFNVADASDTLQELEKFDLPGTDDFWQTTVPNESELAYLTLAERAVASDDLDQALEYAEAGLSFNAESVGLNELLEKLNARQQIAQVIRVSPQQASQLLAQAQAKYGADDPLFATLVVPDSPVTQLATGKECEVSFAGRGLRTRNTCYDLVDATIKGPRLVVVDSSTGPFAIMRYELRVAEYNDYCSMTSNCQPANDKDRNLPITELGITEIEKYIDWLSEKTGKVYRIPTLDEWQHAAIAGGVDQADRNCVAVGGRGLNMEPINYLKEKGQNGWGLAHTVGNARELVLDGSDYKAAGGAHKNNNIDCKPMTVVASDGSADALTGFRLIRNM